jgi:hypothetical protein
MLFYDHRLSDEERKEFMELAYQPKPPKKPRKYSKKKDQPEVEEELPPYRQPEFPDHYTDLEYEQLLDSALDSQE